MRTSSRRSVAAIDADLHDNRTVRRAALTELAVLRRRQAELADIEAELVVAVGLRGRRIDALLDERLGAVREDAGQRHAASAVGYAAGVR
ncbi:hypothetical protein ACI8AC_07365 [Geodermatophilus sp. SYSU D00758]